MVKNKYDSNIEGMVIYKSNVYNINHKKNNFSKNIQNIVNQIKESFYKDNNLVRCYLNEESGKYITEKL